MSFVAVDHQSLACLDLDAMSRWYCDALGMRVVARNDVGRRGVLIGFDGAAPGATMIELTAAKDAGPAPADIGRAAPGWRHVAVRVSDFNRAYARLNELGV